jgi:hypothetical protein
MEPTRVRRTVLSWIRSTHEIRSLPQVFQEIGGRRFWCMAAKRCPFDLVLMESNSQTRILAQVSKVCGGLLRGARLAHRDCQGPHACLYSLSEQIRYKARVARGVCCSCWYAGSLWCHLPVFPEGAVHVSELDFGEDLPLGPVGAEAA